MHAFDRLLTLAQGLRVSTMPPRNGKPRERGVSVCRSGQALPQYFCNVHKSGELGLGCPEPRGTVVAWKTADYGFVKREGRHNDDIQLHIANAKGERFKSLISARTYSKRVFC